MLTLALAATAAALGCAQPPRIDVVAPSARSTTATLTVRACGRAVLGPWRARVGRSGLSAHRREGDGTTPLGTFAIGPVVYGLDPDPGVRLAYHRLRCGDWWDEDPASPTYNAFRHVPCGASPPFGGASEALWRQTVAYREFAVVEYNTAPARPGLGSGIFLHDDVGAPTNGCVSLPRPELRAVLRTLRPGSRIAIRVT
ncbi:MAG TPA: L,D-transpeptidase family protein [Gaiellaceae bacterium]|jgi:L,D-peptidoglycan transpeptidase YkuD (ErfK/YbiS/YcfS/YnhG family)|nr:L,D-transpeptidase family protein [Gaiellaceae bacterium]